jgi:hypothetical protein
MILSMIFGAAMLATPATPVADEAYARLEIDLVRDSLTVLRDADTNLLVTQESRARFTAALAALDGTVARLFETLPPEPEMARHLRQLPLYAELLSAARGLEEAVGGGDATAVEAARDWLEQAAVELMIGTAPAAP